MKLQLRDERGAIDRDGQPARPMTLSEHYDRWVRERREANALAAWHGEREQTAQRRSVPPSRR
jgi:hypothetical protein